MSKQNWMNVWENYNECSFYVKKIYFNMSDTNSLEYLASRACFKVFCKPHTHD